MVAPVLLEVVERLGGVEQRRIGELREGVMEVAGQVDIDAVTDSGVADDVEEPDVLVDVGVTGRITVVPGRSPAGGAADVNRSDRRRRAAGFL